MGDGLILHRVQRQLCDARLEIIGLSKSVIGLADLGGDVVGEDAASLFQDSLPRDPVLFAQPLQGSVIQGGDAHGRVDIAVLFPLQLLDVLVDQRAVPQRQIDALDAHGFLCVIQRKQRIAFMDVVGDTAGRIRQHDIGNGLERHGRCALQIRSECGYSDEQGQGKGERKEHGEIASAAAFLILQGKHGLESEYLLDQPGEADMGSVDVFGLPDRFDRGDGGCALRRPPCAHEQRDERKQHGQSKQRRADDKRHLHAGDDRAQHGADMIQGQRGGAKPRGYAQRDAGDGQEECLEEYALPFLRPGRAYAGQHAQIAAALAQGDVEGVVDDRHGADGDDERDDQRQQLDHEDQLIIACNAFI